MARSRSLLWNRDYRHYWLARVVSSVGSNLSGLAFPLMVLAVGGSPVEATAVATCTMATSIALRMVGGSLADRLDRRWMMLAGDLIRLVAIGSVPLAYQFGRLTYAQILAIALVQGIAGTLLFTPAASIAVRDIVPKEQLVEAASRSASAGGVISLIGPVLGGALFEIGHMLPFELDAASYLFSAIMLITMAAKPMVRDPAARNRSWSAGIRWLRGQPTLLRCLAGGTVLNIAGAAFGVSLIVVMSRNGVPGSAIGLVMAFGGAGTLVGSLLAPRLIPQLRTTQCFLLTSVVWTAGFAILALSVSPWVVAPVMAAITGVTPLGNVGLVAAITTGVPRDILGRVNAAIATVTGGLACLGPLIGGVLLQTVGSSGIWLVFCALTFAVMVTINLPLARVETLVKVGDVQDGDEQSAGQPVAVFAESAASAESNQLPDEALQAADPQLLNQASRPGTSCRAR
jgi:MFS family permease